MDGVGDGAVDVHGEFEGRAWLGMSLAENREFELWKLVAGDMERNGENRQ